MREVMKPFLIVPIELYPQVDIYNFVLKIGEIDQVQNAINIAKENRQCTSILCDFNEVNIDTLLRMDIQPSVMMYINCIFNGDLLSVIKSLNIKEHSPLITYLFPANTPSLVTLLKVLSSCGYQSGMQLDCENMIDKDTYIEIASYSYLSPIPHAQIEPFGFIQQEIHNKKVKFVDINKFYFNSPETSVLVSKDGGVYLNCVEFPEFQRRLCDSVEAVSHINFEKISLEYKKLRFYNHFDNEDECSKCAHFKLCSGFYKNRLVDCQETISTIYEMLF